MPAEERQAHKLVSCNQWWITHRQQFSQKRNNKNGEHLPYSGTNTAHIANKLISRAEKAFHTIVSKTPENISNKDFDDVANCSIRPVQRGNESTPHSDKLVQKTVRKKKVYDVSLMSKKL